jgi:hypothetical protein
MIEIFLVIFVVSMLVLMWNVPSNDEYWRQYDEDRWKE